MTVQEVDVDDESEKNAVLDGRMATKAKRIAGEKSYRKIMAWRLLLMVIMEDIGSLWTCRHTGKMASEYLDGS
jgi:hypothetical protein